MSRTDSWFFQRTSHFFWDEAHGICDKCDHRPAFIAANKIRFGWTLILLSGSLAKDVTKCLASNAYCRKTTSAVGSVADALSVEKMVTSPGDRPNLYMHTQAVSSLKPGAGLSQLVEIMMCYCLIKTYLRPVGSDSKRSNIIITYI